METGNSQTEEQRIPKGIPTELHLTDEQIASLADPKKLITTIPGGSVQMHVNGRCMNPMPKILFIPSPDQLTDEGDDIRDIAAVYDAKTKVLLQYGQKRNLERDY